jgi:hypothetical protein
MNAPNDAVIGDAIERVRKVRWRWHDWMRDVLCGAGLVALCLAIGMPRYRVGIDLSDEGFLAYGAVRVMEGQVPNRDFVSLQPPFSFYSTAAVFAVLGPSYASLRTFGLCLYVIVPLLLFAISRQQVGRIASLAAAVPATVLGLSFFGFVPFAVWQGTTAVLVATLCLLRAAVSGRRLWGFVAGLATAAAIACRHDQGAYLVLAVLAYAWALKVARRNESKLAQLPLVFWGLGTAAPLAILGVVWLSIGALPGMFQQLVVFLATTYHKTSSLPWPVYRSNLSVHQSMIVTLFYVPPAVDALVAIGLFVARVRRRFSAKHAHLTFLLALSLLFYCQVLTRSDLHHLIITLAPFFVVVVWSIALAAKVIAEFIDEPGPGTKIHPLVFVAAAFGGAFLVYFDAIVNRPPTPAAQHNGLFITLNLPRGGVQLRAQNAKFLESIVHLIWKDAPPGSAILALPYNPGLYFLAERRNPTRWNYLWPGDQTSDDQRTLIEQAKRDPPSVIILEDEKRMEAYARPIVDYVKSAYKLQENLPGFKIYVPRSNH